MAFGVVSWRGLIRPWIGRRPEPYVFADRVEAGRALARQLRHYAERPDALVLGLPRGGVPVAFEVADALGLALDTFVVRKLGVPGQAELAMGAIASGGASTRNADVIESIGLGESEIEAVAERERRELARRERLYRGARAMPRLRNRVIVLVDDGLATGASMRVAIAALRRHAPAWIVAAAPVAALQTAGELAAEADETAFTSMPEPFEGVSRWYADFRPISDARVQEILTVGWRRKIGSRARRSVWATSDAGGEPNR